MHQELKRPGATLMLLWEEYATGNPLAYKYTSFRVKYSEFARRLCLLGDAGDRIGVARVITDGIFVGSRRLAKHVV